MQFIYPLYLITSGVDETVNEVGDVINTPSKRKVYCDINSIKQSEFYQAQASGFKPESSVTIRSFEYSKEEKAELNGIEYKILRSYDKRDGTLELILTRGVEDVST